jgi:GDPmannose 4,6-dehydratase
MLTAFITGINGQDGSYLAELLLKKGYNVYGIIRRMSLTNTQRIDHLLDKLTLFYGDVTDSVCISSCISEILVKHDSLEVYHLAAQSHVKVSFEIPEYTFNVDALGTMKILESCKQFKDRIKVYIACTSEMYGKVLETPQTEKTPFNPCSPYGIAKQASFYLAKNYRESYGMFVCSGILFNHESPRRGTNFVTRKVTIGLGKILRGEIDNIEMGNLDSVRDWGHAKDYVRAMYLMLQHEVPDDYVIATNETHTVREFIERAFEIKGLHLKWEGDTGIDQNGITRIKINPRYFRPVDVDFLKGCPEKAYRVLNWKTEITFEELINDMVENDTNL